MGGWWGATAQEWRRRSAPRPLPSCTSSSLSPNAAVSACEGSESIKLQMQAELIARQVSSRVRDLHAAAAPAFNASQFARALTEDEKAAIVRDWLAEHARCAAWKHSGSERSLASNFYVFVRDAEGTPRVRDSWPALGEEELTTPPGLEFFCLHKHASRSPRHRIGRADHYCVVLTDEVGRAT